MSSIYLDPNTNDIIIENGCVKSVTGCEEIVQCIRQKIMNLDIVDIFSQGVNIEGLTALIKSSILDTSGVISLVSFSSEVSKDSCNSSFLNINFVANTVCGEVRVFI